MSESAPIRIDIHHEAADSALVAIDGDGDCALSCAIPEALHKRRTPMRLAAMNLGTLVLLGASLAACGMSAPDEADTAESAQAITGSTCAQFGTINQGDYIIQADEWNSTQQQCISSTGLNFRVTTANFNLSSGAPATYPSIYKGCHWGGGNPAPPRGRPGRAR